MIERGRAIPSTQTVPIVAERRQRAVSPPQYVDGRVSSNLCIDNGIEPFTDKNSLHIHMEYAYKDNDLL